MSGPVVMCEWKCASASLVTMGVVRFLQHRNVQVLVCSMCEWSDFYNTGMCEWSGFSTRECARASLVNVRVVLILQHRNVRVNMKCASASLVCES